MEVCSFCQVSIRPLKNHLDFFTTTVAVGGDVGLMQGSQAFHDISWEGFSQMFIDISFPYSRPHSALSSWSGVGFPGRLEIGVPTRYQYIC